jgi:hypothetical protein
VKRKDPEKLERKRELLISRLAELQRLCDEAGVQLRRFKLGKLPGRHSRLIGMQKVDYWPLSQTAFVLGTRTTIKPLSVADAVRLASGD